MIRWLGAAMLVAIVALTAYDSYRRGRDAHAPQANPTRRATPAAAPVSATPRETNAAALPTRRDGILFVNETTERKYDLALRGSIRGFQERTGVELGIVLLDRLPPNKTIEDHAVDIIEHARLGGENGGRSILFLWSEAERLFKIEVSYELEGVFPDSTCAHLEAGARTFMLAKLAYARRDFLTELIVTMGIHWLDFKKTGRLGELILPFAPGGYQLSERHLTGGAGIVGRGYAATAAQIAKEIVPLPASASAGTQPHTSVDEVVRRYRASLAGGIGDPRLAFLTEGSRFHRLEQPQAPGYLRRIYTYQEKALPLTIIAKDRVAAAVFQPGHPVLPILLRKNDHGEWLVDEAGAWANFHLFELGENPVLKYHRSPYAFAWEESGYRKVTQPIYTNRAEAPDLPAYPHGLLDRLARAETELAADPSNVARLVALANVLHFEMYWLEAAAPLYEAAIRIERKRDDLRWRLVDVYMNTTEVPGMERMFRELYDRNRDPLARSYLEMMKRWYW